MPTSDLSYCKVPETGRIILHNLRKPQELKRCWELFEFTLYLHVFPPIAVICFLCVEILCFKDYINKEQNRREESLCLISPGD